MIVKLVPTYKSRSWRPFIATFKWDQVIANAVHDISAKRWNKRIDSYVIPGEFSRSKGSLRFGNKKEGHGFHKGRGDFCLVGGCIKNNHLTVFYRRVELLGGLHYDLAVFNEIGKHFDFNRVTIMAAEACVFCVRGNSNEKFYAKVRKLYDRRD